LPTIAQIIAHYQKGPTMNPAEIKDLKQLAMLAELARPLSHECNNFLNNLLMQLAISEKSFPESSRAEWANIRSEGRKLANLFQQWQRQRKQSCDGPTKIEFNQLIQETAAELRLESGTVQLLVQPAEGPLWVKGFTGDVQCLVTLLLRYALAALQGSGDADPAIDIHLGESHGRIVFRLLVVGAPGGKVLWADFDDVPSSERITLSLPALTCKSLADRLEGSIRIERDAHGRRLLAVELPSAR